VKLRRGIKARSEYLAGHLEVGGQAARGGWKVVAARTSSGGRR
jgi:hypothetical protein